MQNFTIESLTQNILNFIKVKKKKKKKMRLKPESFQSTAVKIVVSKKSRHKYILDSRIPFTGIPTSPTYRKHI